MAACVLEPNRPRIGSTILGHLVVGFVVGVGLVAGFKYFSDKRSKWRLQKIAGIHLLSLADEFDFKRLCKESYPSHISFLTFEKVRWVNEILEKIWPFVVEATEKPGKEWLGPVVEFYRPTRISSLTVEKFHLGKAAPHIDGIRVQSLRKSQVHLDMDFKWGSEGDVVLNAAIMGSNVSIQLKDLSFYATIRLIFQLSDQIPCISAYVVAVLPDPKYRIDYNLKVGGGNTAAIPGLGDMIEDLVHSCITDMLEWPRRLIFPIGDTPMNVTSDLELKPQGKLTVTVVRANDLKNMETIGISDPYVVLYVRVLFKKKTRVIHHNLNPEWNDPDSVFHFDVEDTETQTLVLQVKDEEHFGTDKELGVTVVPLCVLKPDTEIEIRKKLAPSLDTVRVKDEGDRGSITVKLLYHLYTETEQLRAMVEEKEEIQAKEDLKNAGVIGGNMDALTKSLKPSRNGTETVESGVMKVGRMMSKGIKSFIHDSLSPR
ncbi:calcium-dependent lipid-binding protein [Physcomitrium patens]|uniref:Uncharacterized protein n=1 Tax=Physcomitrium patens TaxID=3218 RepID=A0A2K1IVB7_PHYPA|nr:synaptotagmin-5-like [Physcomitrium patens]XP_024358066.1 synaptotagmin-5-like [Physcomitrium patens]PNR33227.1 hypothetical protein PHYPA_025170 [Physcomitrium patens]|eukprot:XP_024358065.1 synaptotagmin-5-like [Physcomitrella patens]